MFKSLNTNINRFFSQRKIKIWKPKHYEAIPSYVRPMTRDPFEYKLRGKAQLDEEHKIKPPVFDCRLTYTWYNWADGVFKDRNRKVKVEVFMKSMNLSKLQKERLVQLLGSRYKLDNDIMILTCDMYDEWEQNYHKALEMIKELYLEAKRAP